jgi:ribonuclease P protein component
MSGRPPIGPLCKRSEFLAVAGARRKCAMPGLVLQARRWAADEPLDAPDSPARRVGFTATRRVGGAVVRNRARRRLRAVAREILPAQAADRYDYVLIARAATGRRPFESLKRDLEKALDRVGALRSETTEDTAP